jgi:hypothetical protein
MAASDIRAGGAYIELLVKGNALTQLTTVEQKMVAIGTALRHMGYWIGGFGSAITAALGVMAFNAGETGRNLTNMAIRTGLSIQTLQEMGLAAQRAGLDLSMFEKDFRRMQRGIAEGGPANNLWMRQLHLGFGQLAGLSPEKQFLLIADAITAIENPTKRAAMAMMTFGQFGAGTGMLPMIQNFIEVRRRAHSLGLVLSDTAISGLDKLGISFKEIRLQLRALSDSFIASSAKAIEPFLLIFQRLLSWVIKFVQTVPGLAALTGIVGVLATSIGGLLITVGAGIGLAPYIFKTVLTGYAGIMKLIAALPVLIAGFWKAIKVMEVWGGNILMVASWMAQMLWPEIIRLWAALPGIAVRTWAVVTATWAQVVANGALAGSYAVLIVLLKQQAIAAWAAVAPQLLLWGKVALVIVGVVAVLYVLYKLLKAVGFSMGWVTGLKDSAMRFAGLDSGDAMTQMIGPRAHVQFGAAGAEGMAGAATKHLENIDRNTDTMARAITRRGASFKEAFMGPSYD